MKNILFLVSLLFVGAIYLQAQDKKPYAKFGYEGKVLKTPQERQQYMLTIPNPDQSSDIALVGIAPNEDKYYLFDKDNELLDEDVLMNSELGRFFSVDPLTKKYPFYTPYAFSGNRIIDMVELEGLEPAEPGSTDGEYAVANEQGSNDFFGWGWSQECKEWIKGSSTQYSRGNAANNSGDDDLTKTFHPEQEINTRDTDFTDEDGNRIDGLVLRHQNRFANSYGLGTLFVGTDEDNILLNNFIEGNDNIQPFDQNSDMAGLISTDEGFVTLADAFETAALSYFNENGSLEGFNGNGVLRNMNNLTVRESLFMRTVMGGTQQVDAQIRSISVDRIEVTYTIWDHFGAGTTDAVRNLPGLPSMYWLQHNSTEYDNNVSDQFTPFIWSVEVNRGQ